jgi:glutamate-5-semialdehyde dehydrogenase
MSEQLAAVATRAREAAIVLALATRAQKDGALEAMAQALLDGTDRVLAANAEDVAAAVETDTPAHLVDRLRLDRDRVRAMAAGLRDVARLPDPVGEVLRGSTLPNGLELRQVRVPFGVVGVIYEARPNVTADAAGICLKSGNAVLLRGSSSALRSNTLIVEVLREAIAGAGLPADCVALVPGEGHEPVKALMRARGLVDVLIPRGGAGLIRSVVEESTVPVIETGVGNCHLYIDSEIDGMEEQVRSVCVNAKTSYPGGAVCNAVEHLLFHDASAPRLLPKVCADLAAKGVEIRGDDKARALYKEAKPTTDADWDTEYLNFIVGVKVVSSMDEAIDHINRHGSHHTDGILSSSRRNTDRFVQRVDSASVVVNASTRVADAGEYGLGAEIGISTDKLHARGPMGAADLTTYKWIVTGDGHVRG